MIIENKGIAYVILRSVDEMLENENYFKEGHDIDILCAQHDLQKISEIFSINKNKGFEIKINECLIQVDIESTAEDSAIPMAWKIDMLRTRRFHKSGLCHILDSENYYYSLLYHSFADKGGIPERYFERLGKLEMELGLTPDNRRNNLYNYMRRHGYGTDILKNAEKNELCNRKANRYLFKRRKHNKEKKENPQIHLYSKLILKHAPQICQPVWSWIPEEDGREVGNDYNRNIMMGGSLCLVSEKNIGDYVDINLFFNGVKIDKEIIRLILLAMYGGCWIESKEYDDIWHFVIDRICENEEIFFGKDYIRVKPLNKVLIKQLNLLLMEKSDEKD